MKVDSVDNRGSTPLHWSCYSGCEIASTYLLAFTTIPQMNILDYEGLSPLHLAIKSSLATGSTRIIRHLLLKGADKNLEVELFIYY